MIQLIKEAGHDEPSSRESYEPAGNEAAHPINDYQLHEQGGAVRRKKEGYSRHYYRCSHTVNGEHICPFKCYRDKLDDGTWKELYVIFFYFFSTYANVNLPA